jgi:hypothetical protein
VPNRSYKRRPRPPQPGDLFPIPVSAGSIRAWGFRDALEWCADRDGILRRDRLRRMQEARGYQKGWTDHLANRSWEEVYRESCSWWAARRRRERRNR